MTVSRYRLFYESVIKPELLAKMQYKNVHMVPKMQHITVSMSTRMKPTGLDSPIPSAFLLELLTGQQAVFTRTKDDHAKYKVRKGVLEGAKVVLRGESMYHFMDRLVTQVLPRVVDFNGLSPDSFDGRGNFALGIKDLSVFHEIESQAANLDRFGIHTSRGVGILMNTTAKTDAEARLLLAGFRFPFR